MSDSNLFAVIYESLTKPVRERPFASLIFFAALLGVGAWLTQWFQGIPEPWREALIILLLTLPSVGIVLCLHRLLVTGDQPASLRDPTALEGIKKSFVGREDDAEVLVGLILRSSQVWFNGDSGVGKSVLLQRAVLPELESRGIATIYLNSWRGDWEEAPAKAILAKLNVANQDDALGAFQKALESSKGLIIILDQFDEFQIEHSSRFILEHGHVISRPQLEESNRFFQILNAAVRRCHVHCVFVTRRDVEWGKRVVLLEEAEELFLKRLPKNVVEAEIGRVVSATAIVNADSGWGQLREQVCNDLDDGGILPVQMRFAVLGLEELRHNLTRPAYFHIGRVNGLISHYIEREIRRISGGRSLAVILFPLLNQMVASDGNSTVPMSEQYLLREVPEDSKIRVLQALEELERRDIVGRVLQEGNVLWRLDHDYLAGPVREIARRQLPEQWEMKERYERFLTSPSWQKPLRLAGLWTIARLTRAKILRGLRFGPAATWFLFSISAWLALFAGLLYTGFDIATQSRDEQMARKLFSAFELNDAVDQMALGEWNRYSVNRMSSSETSALLQIAESDTLVRRDILEIGLGSVENARRLLSHQLAIPIALSRMDANDSRQLSEKIIRPFVTGGQPDPAAFAAAFHLLRFWNELPVLKEGEAQQIASNLLARMEREKDTRTLQELAFSIGVLKDQVSPEIVNAAASRLVEQMVVDTDSFSFSDLTSGLYDLKGKIQAPIAEKLASKLVNRMTSETSSRLVGQLAITLGVLKDQVDQPMIEAAASKVMERMVEENNDTYSLDVSATGLRVLESKIGLVKAGDLAKDLVHRIAKEQKPDLLAHLASGLDALKNEIEPHTANELATILAERMANEHDRNAMIGLARGLAALEDKASSETIKSAVRNLVEHTAKEKDGRVVNGFAQALTFLKTELDSQTADALASKLVDWMTSERDLDALCTPKGLWGLKGKITRPTAEILALRIIDRMSKNGNAIAFRCLAGGFAALSGDIGPQIADNLVSTFVQKISGETDAGRLGDLAYLLTVLPEGSLHEKDLSQVTAVFRIRHAPCRLVLRLDPDARRVEVAQQLANPVCPKYDWNLLALDAARITGRPIAEDDKSKPEEILVNFTELSAFVTGERPKKSGLRLGIPMIASLVLLLGAAVSCLFALAKFPRTSFPAQVSSQA